MLPAAVSVYVDVHDPEESVHELEPNEPFDGSEVVNVTVPDWPDPVTVAVHVVDPPVVNDVGVHDTDVDVIYI